MGFIQRLITCIVTICNAQWTAIYDPLLPQADWGMACASYNGSIFLLGGYLHAQQVTEYKISTQSMINHGETASATYLGSHGQAFWYQWNETLYIYSTKYSQQLYLSYDLKTSNFWQYPSFIPPISIEGGTRSCITGNNHYLTISGAFPPTNEVHILLLSNNTWIAGASMQTGRYNHGCCFVSDYLYEIAGDSNGNTIEKIHADDLVVASQSWSLLADTFATKISQSSIVPYYTDIYVIGAYLNPPNYPDGSSIYVLDTTDDSLTLLEETLPYDVHQAAAIAVDDVLYIFGGRYDIDHYIIYSSRIEHQLATKSPTLSTMTPSKEPSDSPTSSTLAPSDSPTFATLTPSDTPTLATLAPSDTPTAATLTPSKPPTAAPNKTPSQSPVLSPTKRPSESPSKLQEGMVAAPFTTTDDELSKVTNDNYDDNDETVNFSITYSALWIAVISLSVFVCGAICCFVYCIYDRARLKRYVEEMDGINRDLRDNTNVERNEAQNIGEEDYNGGEAIGANVKHEDDDEDNEDSEDLYDDGDIRRTWNNSRRN